MPLNPNRNASFPRLRNPSRGEFDGKKKGKKASKAREAKRTQVWRWCWGGRPAGRALEGRVSLQAWLERASHPLTHRVTRKPSFRLPIAPSPASSPSGGKAHVPTAPRRRTTGHRHEALPIHPGPRAGSAGFWLLDKKSTN